MYRGITQDEYDQLFLAQAGKCKICEIATVLIVDHDHKTEEVRGLLCNRCNSNPLTIDNLAQALRYLSASRPGFLYRPLTLKEKHKLADAPFPTGRPRKRKNKRHPTRVI